MSVSLSPAATALDARVRAWVRRPGSDTTPRTSTVLLASAVVPGLGSIINGEATKGLGILLGFVVSALLSVVLIGIMGMFAFWLWGLIDAYDGATGWDRPLGNEPQPH